MSKREKLTDDDREFDKSAIGLIASILMCAIGIFVIIHFAFTWEYGFIYKGDNLEISDWLLFSGNYVGSMVGGIAAIIGVIMTVRNNQKRTAEMMENNRDETRTMIKNNLNTTIKLIVSNKELESERRRHDVLPVIIINKFYLRFEGFGELNNEPKKNITKVFDLPPKRIEEQIDKFIFQINEKNIDFKYRLSDNQVETVQSINLRTPKGNVKFNREAYYQYEIQNMGRSVAVNMIMSFKSLSRNNMSAMSNAVSISANKQYILGFYVNGIQECIDCYVLSIKYWDIDGNEYIQDHELSISDERIFSLGLVINQVFLGSDKPIL